VEVLVVKVCDVASETRGNQRGVEKTIRLDKIIKYHLSDI